MSRTQNATKNIITGMLNKLVVMFFPFIIRTIIIQKLGSEYLGLNSLFTSILQVLNITELGFNSAVVYSMYKPIAEKDTSLICALLNFYKKIYRVTGIIILAIGLMLLPFLPNLIKGSYPSEINIYVLYLIYLANTVITYFMFAYKTTLLTAHQRTDIANNVNTIIYIIQYIIQIFILFVLKNYYLYILVNTVTVIANNLVCAKIAKKKYPEYIEKGKLDKETINMIKKKVYGLMVQKVCETTRNSLDSIFISAFLGLEIVAIYGNYYTIIATIMSFMSSITSSITASIGNSIATETVEKNYKDMNKFNFIYMWFSGWCTICLLCLYQPFMMIWMGEKYMFSFGVVICLCVYFYSLRLGVIRGAYSDAVGLWYETRFRAIAEAVANIILNFLFVRVWGVYGIIFGTLISLLIINFGYGSQIVFKYYFKEQKINKYFKDHLIYALITLIIAGITYLVCSLIPENGIVFLAIKAIICVIVPNILYLLIYYKTEQFNEAKNFVRNMPIIKKVLNKVSYKN